MDDVNKYHYNSLEDFLISNPLTVDGQLDDGWGVLFPVKGREIEATILFADIASFTKRTLELNSTETLIFLNNFFTWITTEALRKRPGIVDKYIGDEVMVVFSKEFGSDDCFEDALQTARWMAENDLLNFCPQVGIAKGVVTIGYIGTPVKYNCSVFGNAVSLAARCAAVKPEIPSASSIFFPTELWTDYTVKDMFPPKEYKQPDGTTKAAESVWELRSPRTVKIKNMPDIDILEAAKISYWKPAQPAEEQARRYLQLLQETGAYKPQKFGQD